MFLFIIHTLVIYFNALTENIYLTFYVFLLCDFVVLSPSYKCQWGNILQSNSNFSKKHLYAYEFGLFNISALTVPVQYQCPNSKTKYNDTT